jgi:hypothetical protein
MGDLADQDAVDINDGDAANRLLHGRIYGHMTGLRRAAPQDGRRARSTRKLQGRIFKRRTVWVCREYQYLKPHAAARSNAHPRPLYAGRRTAGTVYRDRGSGICAVDISHEMKALVWRANFIQIDELR